MLAGQVLFASFCKLPKDFCISTLNQMKDLAQVNPGLYRHLQFSWNIQTEFFRLQGIFTHNKNSSSG